ncbi:MAG TPA: AI-2E family transporter [Acidothermaceae bacterium]|nr:AI-2E family transporter [Acidothermaceae bacterium]
MAGGAGGAGKPVRPEPPEREVPSAAAATILGPNAGKRVRTGAPAGETAAEPAHALIPRWLYTGGAWSWRLIVIGIVAYYILHFLLKIELVVVPFLGAMVFTALLRPLSQRLQRRGFSRLLATWTTFLISLIIVLGLGTLVVYRSIAEWHTLVNDLSATTDKLRHWLSTGPLHLKNTDLKDLQQKLVDTLNQHRGVVVNDIISGASIVGEAIAGTILAAFITFFLLYDGERIWRFVRAPLRPRTAERMDRAAGAAWHTLAGYIRGSVVIALIHAVVMAVSLLILRVPLVAPLALLVFVTSFIPLIGVLIGGGLSVFVTLGTQGLTPGIILLAILVVEHQLEGHLLQPFIMGRYVRIHPLAIALALATGGILQGILGAIIAVPLVAMVHAAWPHLRESELTVTPDEPPPPGHVLVGGPPN